MNAEEIIASACQATGIPFANDVWPKEIDMPLPCLVFGYDGENVFFTSDGRRLFESENWTVTLYARQRLQEFESKVQQAFQEADIVLGEAMSARDEENNWRWTMWSFVVPKDN